MVRVKERDQGPLRVSSHTGQQTCRLVNTTSRPVAFEISVPFRGPGKDLRWDRVSAPESVLSDISPHRTRTQWTTGKEVVDSQCRTWSKRIRGTWRRERKRRRKRGRKQGIGN